MGTMTLTHEDAVRLLESATLGDDAHAVLTEAVVEAEDAAICDDVFLDIDDDTRPILNLVRARGIQHQVH